MRGSRWARMPSVQARGRSKADPWRQQPGGVAAARMATVACDSLGPHDGELRRYLCATVWGALAVVVDGRWSCTGFGERQPGDAEGYPPLARLGTRG